MIKFDPLSWIPDPVKQQVFDSAIEFLAENAKSLLGDQVSETINNLKSDSSFKKSFNEGLKRASKRFEREYFEKDEDLVVVILQDKKFWESKSVKKALIEIIKHPSSWSPDEKESLINHFDDALPYRRNRQRVDQAITYFLGCLTEEIWHLDELKPIYQLKLQKVTAESASQMVREMQGLRGDFQNTMLLLVKELGQQQKLLASSQNIALPAPVQKRVLHNLPQPDYDQFIGRIDELEKLNNLLSPVERVWCVVIDGIGGIGKSALALEISHRQLYNGQSTQLKKTFEAIIWASAKETTLTADGIKQRQRITNTLEDIYKTIAITLELDGISSAKFEEQSYLIRRALTRQRTLLIIDNLETIDDERVLAFIRELPDPTKCIVTSRHRLDVAHSMRLTGLPQVDALTLITNESMKRGLSLDGKQAKKLFDRTGGIPLAIVWSVAQMGYGWGVNIVLERLGHPTSNITRYCFEGAVDKIRNEPSFQILVAISIAEKLNRSNIGIVTNLPEIDRDEGLVILEKLSLVNKKGDIFDVLPLVRQYTLSMLPDVNQTQLAEMLIHLNEQIPSSHYLNQVQQFVQVSYETRDAIAKSIGDQLWYAVQSYDEHSAYYYLYDLERIGTKSAIDNLKWVSEQHQGLIQHGDWIPLEAIKSLVKLGEIKHVLLQVNKVWPTLLDISSILKEDKSQNTILQIEEFIQETPNFEGIQELRDVIGAIRNKLSKES